MKAVAVSGAPKPRGNAEPEPNTLLQFAECCPGRDEHRHVPASRRHRLKTEVSNVRRHPTKM